jgi:hypothetical protein
MFHQPVIMPTWASGWASYRFPDGMVDDSRVKANEQAIALARCMHEVGEIVSGKVKDGNTERTEIFTEDTEERRRNAG